MGYSGFWGVRQKLCNKRAAAIVEGAEEVYAADLGSQEFARALDGFCDGPGFQSMVDRMGRRGHVVKLAQPGTGIAKSREQVGCGRSRRQLVEAWNRSSLRDDAKVELIIAGPDEGDYGLFADQLDPGGNVSYVGPTYGPEKENVLKGSTFYVLPSYSEGLPVSVLEAIASGLVPVITDECNVPDFFVDGGAVRITADVDGIVKGLEEVRGWSRERVEGHRSVLRAILESTYDIRIVAGTLLSFYSELLRKRT